MRRDVSFLFALVAAFATTSAIGAPSSRQDLSKLGALLCRAPTNEQGGGHGSGAGLGAVLDSAPGSAPDSVPDSTRPWELGIHDAQIEVAFLESRPKKQAGSKRQADLKSKLKKRAIAMAKRMRHGGYAYGVCGPGSGWILSAPSPQSMTLSKDRNTLTLPNDLKQHLKRRCKSYSVAQVGFDGGVSVGIPTNGKHLTLQKKGPGTVSLTCQPKTPSWQGPVVWFLAPTGGLEDMAAPIAESFHEARDARDDRRTEAGTTSPQDPKVALATWINAVRRRGQLSTLRWGDETLHAEADRLAIGGRITHDRRMLSSARRNLKSRKQQLLGELRVKAQSPEKLAALLWNSPRHRDLLLHPKASRMGLYLKAQDGEYFAVVAMVESTEDRLKLSTGGSTVKAPKKSL